ncbi:MAG TPA: hypothetical protein VI670_27840 [Thermoanaerobaculia bacterium]
MKRRPVAPLVRIALDHLVELTQLRQQEIARMGRVAEGLDDEWLLDPMRVEWVIPDEQPTGGKDAQANDDAGGSVRTDA